MDAIQIDDHVYDTSNVGSSDTRTQVLKCNDTFAVIHRQGTIGKAGVGEQGLYHRGTRHLSFWDLLIDGHRPMLLNSAVKRDNSLLIVESTTPDIHDDEDALVLGKGTLHVSRSLVVQNAALHEHLLLTNYGRHPVELTIEYRFESDFRDIFEVRGVKRMQRGEQYPARVEEPCVTYSYRGLDDVARSTSIHFNCCIEEIEEERCLLSIRLAAGGEQRLDTSVTCTNDHCPDDPGHRVHVRVLADIEAESRLRMEEWVQIETSNEQFNEWIARSQGDLMMLTTAMRQGDYPYAGVPWFSTPFGRDGLITALQTLWAQPQLSRGVLSFLAATQADEVNPARDAEPGKILHEWRDGEMAALGEIPFDQYYGTVDATPLFVTLAGQYFRRTRDREFVQSLWPNIRRAIEWIDEYGDCDGDGFVEYTGHDDGRLVQLGWKDSDDSVFHRNGDAAEGPIALCEVQGYVYEAKVMAAELALLMDDPEWGARLRGDAVRLKERFNSAFWLESLGTYAIALDGQKRPCAVRSSNAGQVLFSGIATPQHAQRLKETLMSPASFSGWGIRTVAAGETRYNPMSYHNGSIWPHDTSMVAAGLARYGFRQETLRVTTGLFEASKFLDLHRLPELFCGFDRIPGHPPTQYPVACSPQAWASGAAFLLLQACLGLTFSLDKAQIQFAHPVLPEDLHWVTLRNLGIGEARVDLEFRRHARDLGLHVDQKVGDLEIVVVN